MALPTSGVITLNDVNIELGLSGTSAIGMGDAAVRGLFGIASGEIEMSDGYGKSDVVPAYVVASGTNGGAIADAQAGDVVVALNGNLTNSFSLLMTGFTSIAVRQSSYQWSPSSNYYTKGHLQYKILTGAETTIPTSNGQGNWVQYRMPRPITSVTLSGQTSSTSVMSGTYPAVTETSTRLACIRVVGSAGYNCANTTQTLSTGSPQTVASANTRAKFLSVSEFGSGTYYSTNGAFVSPTFYSTITCNG